MWILSEYRYFRFSKVENMVIVGGLGHPLGFKKVETCGYLRLMAGI